MMAKSNIPIQWVSNVLNDPKAKKSLEESILLSNSTVLERLREILHEREASLESSLFSLSTPKELKLSLVDRIGELRDVQKLLNIG